MNQLYIFLCFFLTGIVIGILFDIFRILRRSFKTWDIVTYIQDFIFWILSGVILLYSIFTFNNGELRAFVFIGILLGITLYILLISKYFIKIAVKIILIIKKILFYPINFIKKHIIKPIYKIIIKHIIKPIYKIIIKYIIRPFSSKISKIHFKFPKINLKKKKSDNLSNKIRQLEKDFLEKCRKI